MTKRAKLKKKPTTGKSPRIAAQNSPDSILNRNPAWRFARMDVEGPWGWGNIQSARKFIEILSQKLKNFETMTWKEIDKNGQSHIMPSANISSGAQNRLEEIRLNDIDFLYSIRLSAKERIWGIRECDSFYLLWWDPEHTVYPVPKKHT